MLIKRIKRGATDGRITISPDNKKHEPFELNRRKIYHISFFDESKKAILKKCSKAYNVDKEYYKRITVKVYCISKNN